MSRAIAAHVALGMYLGERCPYCLKVFQTYDDLEDAVFNGYTEHGRIAHGNCFRKAHAETDIPLSVKETE